MKKYTSRMSHHVMHMDISDVMAFRVSNFSVNNNEKLK